MNQELRDRFAALHVPGDPLLLYNIWDVGSAVAVVKGGAPAISTGSHSLAEAQGYSDGEGIPLTRLPGSTANQPVAGGDTAPSTPLQAPDSAARRR